MEKSLYNRGSILLSKSTKTVDKNFSIAVPYLFNHHLFNLIDLIRIKKLKNQMTQ